MILSSGIHLGRVPLLQTAGGCLQHAKGLLVSLMAAAEQQAAGSSGQQGSNPASWRSISTTRGIYMGRVFIRENLVKSATPSTLYTRDNYQFLSEAKWSLNACEQVLANHQAAHNRRPQGRPAYDPINKALNERIRATTTLAELRQVVAEQAHRMSQINLAVVIQRVPQLLHNRAGAEEYDAAALLLDHAAKLLLPKLQWLSGPNICSCLAAFAKCRYGPSSDMLQAMSGQLLADNATKLQRCKLSALAQLMHAQGKFMQDQAQWPLLQAIMEQVMAQLERLPPNAQQQQQHQQQQQQDAQRQQAEAARDANAVAQLAWLLERSQLQSPEFLAALHRWIAAPDNMQHLSTLSLTQLWAAVRGQYQKHRRMSLAAAAEQPQDAAAGSSSSGAAAADASADAAAAAGDSPTAAVPSDEADAQLAVSSSSSSSIAGELQQQQRLLREFFGPKTLDVLAAKTAASCSSMTERELGQLLASLSSIRYTNTDLMAAAAAAFEAMCAAGTPSNETLVSAAWAATALGFPKASLLQPALVAAATQPGSIDGVGVGRLLRVTSMLRAEELQQQRLLLLQALHRRSGARGPAPTALPAAAAAEGDDTTTSSSSSSSSGGGSMPEWVVALADDVSGRLAGMKPREVAHLVAGYAALPGAAAHQGLFAAAAAHIEAHAHMFTSFNDMEMVAAAFEKTDFKAGLAALKALQQQAEQMAASKF